MAEKGGGENAGKAENEFEANMHGIRFPRPTKYTILKCIFCVCMSRIIPKKKKWLERQPKELKTFQTLAQKAKRGSQNMVKIRLQLKGKSYYKADTLLTTHVGVSDSKL